MFEEKLNRIIIAKKGKIRVFGYLSRCEICGINFSAIQPCIICSMKTEKEKKLRRKLTREEFKELFEFFE